MGLPWGHRHEFGRRVGLKYNNYNASVQYTDPLLLERYTQVSWMSALSIAVAAHSFS
jgi:hypothetical protein